MEWPAKLGRVWNTRRIKFLKTKKTNPTPKPWNMKTEKPSMGTLLNVEEVIMLLMFVSLPGLLTMFWCYFLDSESCFVYHHCFLSSLAPFSVLPLPNGFDSADWAVIPCLHLPAWRRTAGFSPGSGVPRWCGDREGTDYLCNRARWAVWAETCYTAVGPASLGLLSV